MDLESIGVDFLQSPDCNWKEFPVCMVRPSVLAANQTYPFARELHTPHHVGLHLEMARSLVTNGLRPLAVPWPTQAAFQGTIISLCLP